MEVILVQRVPKLGELGQKVRVKPGFARNYLYPQRKALPATSDNMAKFEAERAKYEAVAKEALSSAEKRKEALDGLKITIYANAGEEGRLFGSVSAVDVVRALSDLGHHVQKGEVFLPEAHIRQVGEYTVSLRLHGDEIVAEVKLTVATAS